jgi:hypothetical protein
MSHSQQFIFFAIYIFALKGIMFDSGKPFQPYVMKHSSLLDPFISFEEKKCCECGPKAYPGVEHLKGASLG